MGGADEDDDGLEDAVPAAFSRTVTRRTHDDLEPFSFEGLRGASVVVRANGFTYRGVLVGADEGEIYLRGELRYIVLPLSSVTGVRVERAEAPLGLPVTMRGSRDEDES